MNQSTYVTDTHGLQAFYEQIVQHFTTFAPVKSIKKYTYKRVTSLVECEPDSPIPLTDSIKPLFFPKSAKVMKYSVTAEGTEFTDFQDDPLAEPRVILGVKHCDARALQVLDRVYAWDFPDTGYQKRRENTILVSPRCTEAGTRCFCTSLDYDLENLDALDVAVIKGKNDVVYLQARTEKGETLLHEQGGGLNPADESAEKEMRAQYEDFVKSFQLNMAYTEVHKRLRDQYDSPAFDDVSSTCISCNTCAFVCPTCHCFKITDEKIHDEGVRYKSYDSCNNGYFTLMAGGHNPRQVKYRRWRQRAMHKFVYYKERFDVNLCVGCGKCTIACPVKISIFDVVNHVAGIKA